MWGEQRSWRNSSFITLIFFNIRGIFNGRYFWDTFLTKFLFYTFGASMNLNRQTNSWCLRSFCCSCSFPISVHHLIPDWNRTSWRTGSLCPAVGPVDTSSRRPDLLRFLAGLRSCFFLQTREFLLFCLWDGAHESVRVVQRGSLLHFKPAGSCGTILTLKTAGTLAGHQPQPPQLSLRITPLLLLRTGGLAHLYQR